MSHSPQKDGSAAPGGFHFVDLSDQSDGVRKQRRREVKGHVSRINRLQALDRLQRAKAERRTTPRPLASSSSLATVRSRHGYDDTETAPQQRVTTDPVAPVSASVVSMPHPRALSPVFGALPAATFAPGLFQSPGDVIHYFCNVIEPCLVAENDVIPIFNHYCNQKMTFHTLSWGVAIHRDTLRGGPHDTNSLVYLAHRGMALRLVQQALSNLDEENVEMVLFAMICVLRDSPGRSTKDPADVLLFRPHMPTIGNMHFHALLDMDRELPEQTFAFSALVERIGGLENFKIRGIAKTLAIVKLWETSRDLQRPMLPNVWNVPMQPALPAVPKDECGLSFLEVPGGLPNHLRSVLLNMSWVDQMLLRTSVSGRREFDYLRELLLDSHHQIMSVLPWSELTDTQRQGSHLAMYESCRLTAILYSTAVFFPVPARTWCRRLLNQIRRLLQTSNLEQWPEDTTPLRLWWLCISAIGAQGTGLQAYFEAPLRELLLQAQLTSWHAVLHIVRGFIWSDVSCEAGAAIVWNKVGVSEVQQA